MRPLHASGVRFTRPEVAALAFGVGEGLALDNSGRCSIFGVMETARRLVQSSPAGLSSTRRAANRVAPANCVPVPARWRGEVERVLLTEAQIADRIRDLSREIERDFAGSDMSIVSLLNGTVMFLADLIRNLSLPLRLDFMGVSSYGAGTESRELVFTKQLRLELRDRDVLVVDDILDTGKTLSRVLSVVRDLRPRRIKTCVLLDKAARRVEKVEADYVGFEIPDYFVVGYGLDFAERYRNLPFVGVLHPKIYQRAQPGTQP